MMITVIYYTSNREDEAFEQKIRERLLDSIGGLPLISVSQKPIDFGKNICVGDIGTSDLNVYRQLLIGCEAAETPLVATAEADCLYPPQGYFDFVPDDIDAAYRNKNLWVLKPRWSTFRKKEYSLSAQIAGRKYLIMVIKRWFAKEWRRKDILSREELRFFESDLPCINIKTGSGMRDFVGTEKNVTPVERLPYWGSAQDLKESLFGLINTHTS